MSQGKELGDEVKKKTLGYILAVLGLVSGLAWNEAIKAIIEQKDADEETRKIKEVNPGFYCFNFDFLERNISKIKKSSWEKYALIISTKSNTGTKVNIKMNNFLLSKNFNLFM